VAPPRWDQPALPHLPRDWRVRRLDHGYITRALLKSVVNAILAVLLWFLVLLGVDLRIA
jgi:hypothetical protein